MPRFPHSFAFLAALLVLSGCAAKKGLIVEPQKPEVVYDAKPVSVLHGTVWRRFGFAPEPKLRTSYAWKDIDQPASTEHPMQFWLKPLS